MKPPRFVCLGAPLATCALPKGVCYLLTYNETARVDMDLLQTWVNANGEIRKVVSALWK